MPNNIQVLLPIHLPSVFQFVLHYKDFVTNLCYIHFDFIATLSPSKTGEGKICLAPATNTALAGSFDNSCKAILQKVLKLPHTKYFGFQDVMQTIEDLALKVQRYLAQSQFEDKEYKGLIYKNFKKPHPRPYAAGWVMFTSKSTESLYPGFILPWLVQYRTKDKAPSRDGNSDNDSDSFSDLRQDNKGNNSDERNITDGSLDNNDNLKPMTENLNESGNTAKTVVECGFALNDIRVMLKDPDPEILHPIYQIGQKVVYVGDLNHIGLVDGYVSEQYKDYDAYPGYKLFSNVMMGWKYGRSGKAQRKNKGNLLGYDKDSSKNLSSPNSNCMSNNDKGSEYDRAFDALCAKNGHLVLTILEGCKQIGTVRTRLNSKKGQFDKEKAVLILEECFKYVSNKLFPEYEEGDTVAMDHVWAMVIILLYLLWGYPALKGTEDTKCYNNVGIGPEVQSREQDRLKGNGFTF
eukprot:jgi/Psemu1/12817/gm1.12817_g